MMQPGGSSLGAMRVSGGFTSPSPSPNQSSQNWEHSSGTGEAQTSDVATLNGVTLKRGPTGLEIVALEEHSRAGAAMKEEGFMVGDTLTAVGGADVVGRAPGDIFAWIVEENYGSGELALPVLLPIRSQYP